MSTPSHRSNVVPGTRSSVPIPQRQNGSNNAVGLRSSASNLSGRSVSRGPVNGHSNVRVVPQNSFLRHHSSPQVYVPRQSRQYRVQVPIYSTEPYYSSSYTYERPINVSNCSATSFLFGFGALAVVVGGIALGMGLGNRMTGATAFGGVTLGAGALLLTAGTITACSSSRKVRQREDRE